MPAVLCPRCRAVLAWRSLRCHRCGADARKAELAPPGYTGGPQDLLPGVLADLKRQIHILALLDGLSEGPQRQRLESELETLHTQGREQYAAAEARYQVAQAADEQWQVEQFAQGYARQLEALLAKGTQLYLCRTIVQALERSPAVRELLIERHPVLWEELTRRGVTPL